MKFALVNGQRQEAQPGLSGVCQYCGGQMVAKCGEVYANHWAHRARRDCDHWWEPETEWHRAWKDMFPKDWQECVHHAESGEKHVADVKTDQGWVLELQHSYLKPEERRSREDFYQKLIWIVDGTRRKRDKSQFERTFEEGRIVVKELNMWRLFFFPDECMLLRDWAGSSAPVFFDFSGGNQTEDTQLWCLLRVTNRRAYVGPFSREEFIKFHSQEAKRDGRDFAKVLKILNEAVHIVTQRRGTGPSDPRAELLRQTERQYQERLQRKRNRPLD